MSNAENFAECERLVGAGDPDRAVSLLFVPRDPRPHICALYAFNIETARIREQVSQPLPGEIRLQWWRDQIGALVDPEATGGGGHPVMMALAETITRFDLPLDAFDRFIEARIFDLYDDPMPSRPDFEAYAGETASALIMMAAMVLDRAAAAKAADAAGHAGVAQAAAGCLRLLAVHRARGQVYIPADILAAAGCSRDALLAGEREPTKRAIAAMSAFARDHWTAYARVRTDLPASLRPAFLVADLTQHYLRRVEAAGFDGIDAAVRIGPFRRSFLYWRAMRG